MNRFLLILFGLITSFSGLSQNTQKVLIIGVDGCRPDALEAANTPNFDALISNGLYSPDALNGDITISGPGWSAITTGVRSDKHLVTGNNFSGNNYANYPHFFQFIQTLEPDLEIGSIVHWSPINNNILQGNADFILNVGSDSNVATEAIDYLSNNDVDVLFLQFDEVDGAGHGNGFSPLVSNYLSKIEEVDGYVGSILEAIENRPNYDEENWLIVSTTDHGGLGTSHGGNSIEERKVFFLVSGDDIPNEIRLQDSTWVDDSALNCLGDTTELTFDGTDDHVEIPFDPLFDFGASQDFTVECRVRTTAAGDVSIVGNKDWDSGFNKGFVLSFEYPSGPDWKVNIGDGSNRIDLNDGGQIADGAWHTLSVTFDRDGMVKMYEDGVLIDQADMSSIGDINNSEGFFFGTDVDLGYDFQGSIAEVRLWNKVIEETEILNWHCSELNNTHPDYGDIIGHWKLDEASGVSAFDSGPNNLEGTIGDAVWNSADSILVYSYDNTPRLVDVPPTVLNHLCIPIDPSWELEGTAHGPVGIEGCADPAACNYNPEVTCSNDELCDYGPCPCHGDANGDLIVDILDLLAVSSSFGCIIDCTVGDANSDGLVNILDFVAVSAYFGTDCNE